MKALFTSLMFAIAGAAGFCQPVQSSCEAPDSIKTLYEFDAKVLAVREMQFYAPGVIEINQNRIDNFLKMLLAVYNATSLPARDSVVKCKPIHVFPEFDLKSINLGVNSAESWIANFLNGVSPTGNAQADELIDTYHLSPGTYLPSIGFLNVKSEFDLNMPALAAKFTQLPGVNYAEPNYTVSDGSNIVSAPTPIENYEFFYAYRWGDCPSGCLSQHTWHFSVNPIGCTVAFVESYGDPVDFPCELTNTSEAGLLQKFDVTAFTAGQVIQVILELKQHSVAELNLLDASGKLVKKKSVSVPAQTEYRTEFSVNGFPSGTYFLALHLRNGVFTRKIAVQH
ncbi:MAG: T9SS type A sorting domain-containing protein [Saprospiraceae bacterium]|nr:MAG: T9SS type A sorting domain-containing protein [Saprospiraceae bacterium]